MEEKLSCFGTVWDFAYSDSFVGFSVMNMLLFHQQLKERKAPETAPKTLGSLGSWEELMF